MWMLQITWRRPSFSSEHYKAWSAAFLHKLIFHFQLLWHQRCGRMMDDTEWHLYRAHKDTGAWQPWSWTRVWSPSLLDWSWHWIHVISWFNDPWRSHHAGTCGSHDISIMAPKNHVTYSPHPCLTGEKEQKLLSGLASDRLFFWSFFKWQIWQDPVDRSTTIHI